MPAMPISSEQLLLPAILALFAGVAAHFCIQSYRRLSHVPGPPHWGWAFWKWPRLVMCRDSMDRLCTLTLEYGPLLRVGPNLVITSDAEEFRRTHAPKSTYRRSDFYYALRSIPGQDHVLSERNEDVHSELRIKMTPGYSGRDNVTLLPGIDQAILDLCSLIDRKYISVAGDLRPMDLARKVQLMNVDIISDISFDHKFGNLRDDRDNFGYIEEVNNMFRSVNWATSVPAVPKFLTDIGLLQLLSRFSNGKMGIERVKRLVVEQVDKRFAIDGTPKGDLRSDMLASFIQRGVPQKRLYAEAAINLTAGSDTAATVMRAVMLNVMTSPRIHRRLTAEIDVAIADGILFRDEGQVVSEEQARRLPYLQAVIREGLRWRPAADGAMSKVVPPEGDTICGFYLPGGTDLGFSIMAMFRNPILFGPDADSFRPERWLLSPDLAETTLGNGKQLDMPTARMHPFGHETDQAKLQAMEHDLDLAFGAGRYKCLGKPIALMELNKVFVELLRRFDFHLANVLKPWETWHVGLHIQQDMWVTVSRREKIPGREA